jgi:hypothetical protein
MHLANHYKNFVLRQVEYSFAYAFLNEFEVFDSSNYFSKVIIH